MKNKFEAKYYYRAACAIILIAVAVSMFAYVWIPFVSDHNQTNHLTGFGNIGMSLGLYAIVYAFSGYRFRAFIIGDERKASIIAAQIVTLIVTDITEIFISLAILGEFRFFWMITWRYFLLGCVQAVVNGLITVLMVSGYRSIFPPYQILEIHGDADNGLREKMNAVFYKFHVKDSIHYSTADIDKKIRDYDAVLINDIPAVNKNDIVKFCFEQDKRVYITPKISDILVKSSLDVNLFDTPVYLCRNDGITTAELFCKRAFDLIASLAALIILSPLFLVTAIAIKKEDGGPVFFRQERCTVGGKRFMIVKFRSMIVNAEADGRTHPAGEDDDRITKVGKVIRAARIDELPQEVLSCLRDNPRMTNANLIEKIGKSQRTITRILATLKGKGLIVRVGSNKAGYWQVV